MANRLETIFERAKLFYSHDDRKRKNNVLGIYRFLTPIEINNKKGFAKMTYKQRNNGKGIVYSIELDGLESRP